MVITDPSGEIFQYLAGAVIGAGIQGAFGGAHGAFTGGFSSSLKSDFINNPDNKKSGEEIPISNRLFKASIGGLMSYASCNVSAYIKSKSLGSVSSSSFKDFLAILKASELTNFWGNEYSVVADNNGGYKYYTNEDPNSVDVTITSETRFSYHFHNGYGYDKIEGADLTSYATATEKTGHFYTQIVGTGEGNIWYMESPSAIPAKYNFSFGKYYFNNYLTAFHIFKF